MHWRGMAAGKRRKLSGRVISLIMLMMATIASGCAPTTPLQYIAYQQQVQAEQEDAKRQDDRKITEMTMGETTKQTAIMLNAGYPFVQYQIPSGQESTQEKVRAELRFPLIESLLKACKEECGGSDCEQIPDDYCQKAEDEMSRIKAEYMEASGDTDTDLPPPQPPVAPGGVVIVANGATFTGNNFFAPGATAGGNKAAQEKVAARPPIPLPKSNLQTFFDGIFGLSSEVVRAGREIVPQVAPWVAAGYLGGAGIEKKSNYVQDSSLYGRDNNAGRMQYKYIMSSEEEVVE